MRDNPQLRDKPLAVGGGSNQRGVIATCNYEARAFGVRSAMATAQAIKRCPGLIVVPPQMEKYRVASRQILAIYKHYTELVEPLSLDEAYLDVTDARFCQGSAIRMAQEIRASIAATVGITASAGIAPNKFIAKIASDWNKPNGQHVVLPHQVDAFVAALPVGKLHGVGQVTAAKLSSLGATNCADLRTWTLGELQHHFGRFGSRLYELVRGIDSREVCPIRERKSISVEKTYHVDLPDLAACRAPLQALIVSLQARIDAHGAACNIGTLTVKIKFADFRQTTVECLGITLALPAFEALLEQGVSRGKQPIRLLGAGVRLLREVVPNAQDIQLGLFE